MFFVIFAILVLWIIISVTSIKIVKQDEAMIIENFGQFKTVLYQGLHFITPLIDTTKVINWKETYIDNDGNISGIYTRRNTFDMREQVLYSKNKVYTEDNFEVNIFTTIFFQIIDPKIVAYEVMNASEALEKITQATLRNIIGEMVLDNVMTSRKEIVCNLEKILIEVTEKWGLKVNSVDIGEIVPKKSY